MIYIRINYLISTTMQTNVINISIACDFLWLFLVFIFIHSVSPRAVCLKFIKVFSVSIFFLHEGTVKQLDFIYSQKALICWLTSCAIMKQLNAYKLCEKALNCCGKLNFKDLKVIRPGLSYVFINFSQQSFQSSFPIYWYCNTRSSYPFFFCTDNHNDNLYYFLTLLLSVVLQNNFEYWQRPWKAKLRETMEIY